MTATKTKKKKAEKQEEAKLTGTTTQVIDLEDVVGNTAQSRGMGVLTTLTQMGYGLFEKVAVDKEPIWSMLFSERPEEKAAACALIEENEPDLVKLAEDQRTTSQLQSVGVFSLGEGEGYDVIFGMRRCLAAAFNHARYDDPAEIEAKVFRFDNTPSKAQLKLMALSENDNRSGESPMDRAITYKELEREGLSAEEIGRRTGQTGQNVRRYLLLLSKQIEDLRLKIHSGSLSVENALKILENRKRGLPDKGRTAKDDEGGRYRLPGNKGIMKILDAQAKPAKMEDEEWELWCDPQVRKFLCYKLGLNPSVYPVPAPAAAAQQTASTGKKKILKVKKKVAVELMICLGKMDARTWDDATLKDKLENVVQVAEEGAEQKVEKHQKLFDKLVGGYAEGLTVELV